MKGTCIASKCEVTKYIKLFSVFDFIMLTKASKKIVIYMNHHCHCYSSVYSLTCIAKEHRTGEWPLNILCLPTFETC